MLDAIEEKRKSLKSTVADPQLGAAAAQVSAPSAEVPELSEEGQQAVRAEFFAAGVESWLPLLGDLSFPSVSLPLSREACAALARVCSEGGSSSALDALDGGALERAMDSLLAEKGWPAAFVKLSTRSPKDAPQILAKAKADFQARDGLSVPSLSERARIFSELVQNHFSVSGGREACELLAASTRVREDLEYALEAPRYEELGLHIVLRRWDGPIPVANEFRGIVWAGQMNAVGQYYYSLVFPELEALRGQIERDLQEVYEGLRTKLNEAGFSYCIIDFAWLGPKDVRVIEVNAFNGVTLGCLAQSTGLFLMDKDEDRRIITEGPFELRLRTEAMSDSVLRMKLNNQWRDVIAPLGHARASAGSSAAKARAKAPPSVPPGKGLGKGGAAENR